MRRRGNTVGFRTVFGAAMVCVLLAVAAGFGQTSTQAPGLEIREISVRRVAVGEGDPAQSLDLVDVIVGDLLHVRAAVRNGSPGTTYEQLRVDFYFTEVITKEHGLLGSQTVYSLSPGEERLPAISVPTDGFTPGFYVFTAAIADPMLAQDVAGGTQYIVSYTQPETDEYWKVVADRGPRIAELQGLLQPFRSCQYGGIQNAISLNVRNVGTVPLGFSGLLVEVRPQFGKDALLAPLDATTIASGLGTPGTFEGELLITNIDSTSLESTVKQPPEKMANFEVLGRGNRTERLQLVITATPTGDGSTGPQQKVVLPSQEEGAIVFSELDLWQYPQPDGCLCSSSDRTTCYDVPTTNPAIRPSGYSDELLFHVAVNEETAQYRIHALDPRNGESRALQPIGATPLTEPVIRFRAGSEPRLFLYHAYVGTDAGTVAVFTLQVDKREGTAVYTWSEGMTGTGSDAWAPAPGVLEPATSAYPQTFLQLATVSSGTEGETVETIVVSGTRGIHVLSAETGELLQTVTANRIAYRPAVVGEHVWYSVGRELRGALLDVTGPAAPRACAFGFNRDITTAIESFSDIVFWGDGLGNLHALNVSKGCSASLDADWVMESVAELGPVVGLSVVADADGQGDSDWPAVFAADVDGVMVAIEFKIEDGEESFQTGTKATSQGLQLDGGEDVDLDDIEYVTTLTPTRNGTRSRPVILLGPSDEPETVFLTAEFDATSLADGKSGLRWALVALNPGTDPFAVRRVENWGDSIQFVLKLDAEMGPMLEPVLILKETSGLLVVAVPGERLYALDVTDLRR